MVNMVSSVRIAFTVITLAFLSQESQAKSSSQSDDKCDLRKWYNGQREEGAFDGKLTVQQTKALGQIQNLLNKKTKGDIMVKCATLYAYERLLSKGRQKKTAHKYDREKEEDSEDEKTNENVVQESISKKDLIEKVDDGEMIKDETLDKNVTDNKQTTEEQVVDNDSEENKPPEEENKGTNEDVTEKKTNNQEETTSDGGNDEATEKKSHSNDYENKENEAMQEKDGGESQKANEKETNDDEEKDGRNTDIEGKEVVLETTREQDEKRSESGDSISQNLQNQQDEEQTDIGNESLENIKESHEEELDETEMDETETDGFDEGEDFEAEIDETADEQPVEEQDDNENDSDEDVITTQEFDGLDVYEEASDDGQIKIPKEQSKETQNEKENTSKKNIHCTSGEKSTLTHLCADEDKDLGIDTDSATKQDETINPGTYGKQESKEALRVDPDKILDSDNIELEINPKSGIDQSIPGEKLETTQTNHNKYTKESNFMVEEIYSEYTRKVKELELQVLKLENKVLVETVDKTTRDTTVDKMENHILKLENELLKLNQSLYVVHFENNILRKEQQSQAHEFSILKETSDTQKSKYPALEGKNADVTDLMADHNSKIDFLKSILDNQTNYLDNLETRAEHLEIQNRQLIERLLNQSMIMNDVLGKMDRLQEEQMSQKEKVKIAMDSLEKVKIDNELISQEKRDNKINTNIEEPRPPMVENGENEKEELYLLELEKQMGEFSGGQVLKNIESNEPANLGETHSNEPVLRAIPLTETADPVSNAEDESDNILEDLEELSTDENIGQEILEELTQENEKIREEILEELTHEDKNKVSDIKSNQDKKDTGEINKDAQEDKEREQKQELLNDINSSSGNDKYDKMDESDTDSNVLKSSPKVDKEQYEIKSVANDDNKSQDKVSSPAKAKSKSDQSGKETKKEDIKTSTKEDNSNKKNVNTNKKNKKTATKKESKDATTTLPNKEPVPKYLDSDSKATPNKDCYDLFEAGRRRDTSARIRPFGFNNNMDAYCDMGNGGWTVIMRRQDGTVDFLRDWADYKKGFGAVSGEHWIGNDVIHALTNQDYYSLRVDMLTWERQKAHVEYDLFMVDNEENGYKLFVSGYSGTVPDGLLKHSGYKFSTYDVDNDTAEKDFNGSCAKRFSGAWWYFKCFKSQLTGKYYKGGKIAEKQFDGIVWKPWTGTKYSLKKVEMKIRPRRVNQKH